MRRLNLLFQGNNVRVIARNLSTKRLGNEVPSLKEFLQQRTDSSRGKLTPATLSEPSPLGQPSLRYFIETYGCQMNVSDTEIVRSILSGSGHVECQSIEEADLVLANTCAIRENAENKVWHRIDYFGSLRKANRKIRKSGYPLVGVLGCMAERLRDKLLENKNVDFVCGPDAYRHVPQLISSVITTDQKDSNTQLSLEETYADVNPVREASTHSAFVSIMRGCNNMCSFCVVPFTRGRERSRPFNSIISEIRQLSNNGVKEIVLLGQNVNGYHDTSPESLEQFPETSFNSTPGFKNLFQGRIRKLPGARFAELLAAVSEIDPDMRIRFTSPHPKDFPIEVLEVIRDSPNICKSLHIPIQSGSTSTLARMRRGYDRDAFLQLIATVRAVIPGVSISTDIISGFCGETEEEHLETITAMQHVVFDQAFMFAYSLRDKTHAARTMVDDVPEEIKQRRLREIIETFRANVVLKNSSEELNEFRLVLVEGESTKSSKTNILLTGRTDTNKRVVFPLDKILPIVDVYSADSIRLFDDHVLEIIRNGEAALSKEQIPENRCNISVEYLVGRYVIVKIVQAQSTTLRAIGVAYSNIANFVSFERIVNRCN